jgi:S1-C subfamily serine protease
MNTLTGIACVLSGMMLTRAPVPRPPEPDPMARGYMGITVQTGGLMIDVVEPDMPAAKAGLKPGDVLVRIGTLEPKEFNQVIAHVCSFRPGAVIDIEVQRGAERKSVKLKLASRPARLDPPGQIPGGTIPPIDIDD